MAKVNGDALIICSGAEHFGLFSDVSFKSSKFANKEYQIRIKDSIRNKNVIILQSFDEPNDHLMELLITIDAAKRSGANTISVIAPLFPYSRQDRRHDGGTPISARVVCDLLASTNIDRLCSIDLHAHQIQGFLPSSIQFDHLSAGAFLAFHLNNHIKDLRDYVFCSPDAGSVKRTRKLASLCGIKDFCVIIKTRSKENEIDGIEIIGGVKDRKVLIIDDMIDTAGTLQAAMNGLKERGATVVKAVATHGIFSRPAFTRLKGKDIFVTDTVALPQTDKTPETITVFPMRNFITEVIQRMKNGHALGILFDRWFE